MIEYLYVGLIGILCTSTLVLSILLIIVNIKTEKAKELSVTLALNYQLCIGCILHSISFYLIHIGLKSNETSKFCRFQGSLSIFSLFVIMNILCSIAYISYKYFSNQTMINNKSKYYNIIIASLCWLVPLILSIFAFAFGDIKKNYIIYCWTSGNFDVVLTVYAMIPFIVGLVYVIKLKMEVGRFISHFDDQEIYEGFSRRVSHFIFTLSFSIIVFSYDLINVYFLMKVFGNYSFLNYLGCVLENILIFVMCILFGYNKDKWKAMKQLVQCKEIGTIEENEIGLTDQINSGDSEQVEE